MDVVINADFERLYNLGRNLFATILLRDSTTAEDWNRRTETFDRHGLTSFLTEAPFYKPRELPVDQERLGDVRYRKQLIRKLKAPHPSKWTSFRLQIDRDKLREDDYLQKMAAVLAYKWTQKLANADEMSALVLPHQDVETLTDCLDRMGLHQSDAKGVADHVMRTMAERLVDANERFKAVMAEMRARFAEVRADLEPAIKAICDEYRTAELARINEATDAAMVKFDRLSEEVREDFAAQKARTQAVLDENAPSGLTPEEEFRIAVKKAERERKAANRLSRKAKAMLWALAAAATTAGAFFLEVNGTTLVEVLR